MSPGQVIPRGWAVKDSSSGTQVSKSLTQFAILCFELIHEVLLFDELVCYLLKNVSFHGIGFPFSPLKWSPSSPKWVPLCRPTASSIIETNESIFWEDVVKCLESACAKRCGTPEDIRHGAGIAF